MRATPSCSAGCRQAPRTRRSAPSAHEPSASGFWGLKFLAETDAIAVSGGKTFVAGSFIPKTATGAGSWLLRAGSDGAIDTDFGPTDATSQVAAHIATTDVGTVGGLAVQGDGPVVIAGTNGSTIKVARFLTACSAFSCTITLTPVGSGVTVNTTLLQNTSVGILVSRRVGRRLVSLGRVPLGAREKGANRIPWNLKVGGKKLAPGTYEVTLRALRKGKVFDLSRPARLVIR